MRFKNDPQSLVEVVEALHTDGISHETGDAVAPFVVQTFDDAGLATSFLAGPVLPGCEPFGVSLIEVGCPLGG